MGHLVDYDGYNAFASDGRAYADIWCHGVAGRITQPLHLIALVDTGADYLELPFAVAAVLRINLATFLQVPVLTAGGLVPAVTVSGFLVEIQGKQVNVRAQFMNTPRPLLGLNACLTAMDVGFDIKRWLFKK